MFSYYKYRNLFRNIACAFLFLFCLFFSIDSTAQISNKGKDFWISFERHFNASNLDPSVCVINIVADQATSGEVIIHAPTPRRIPFSVATNSSTQIAIEHDRNNPAESLMGQLPAFIPEISQRGIQVISNDEVSVYVQIFQRFANDGTIIFPTEALGVKYIVNNFVDENTKGLSYWNQFSVVATEDDTMIEFTPSVNSADGKYTAGNTYSKVLDKGQIFSFYASINQNSTDGILGGTNGTRIEVPNCKPVAVFSSSDIIKIGECGAGDSLLTQLLPVQAWGEEFVLVPTEENAFDIITIQSDLEDVTLSISSPFAVSSAVANTIANHANLNFSKVISATMNITLNASNNYQQTLLLPNTAYIKADKPVTVMQYLIGASCNERGNNGLLGIGDPSMSFVPPLEQGTNDVNFYSFLVTNNTKDSVIDRFYISVAIEKSNKDSFKINGQAYQNFIDIPGTDYAFRSIDISHLVVDPLKPPNNQLSADGPFIAMNYGLGVNESYLFPAGLALDVFEDGITLVDDASRVILETAVICNTNPSSLTIQSVNMLSYIDWRIQSTQAQSAIITNPPIWINRDRFYYLIRYDTSLLQEGVNTMTARIAYTPRGSLGCRIITETVERQLIFNKVKARATHYNAFCVSGDYEVTDMSELTDMLAERRWYLDNVALSSTNTNVIMNIPTTGLHTINLEVVDINGCRDEYQSTVEVKPVSATFMPGVDFRLYDKNAMTYKSVDFVCQNEQVELEVIIDPYIGVSSLDYALFPSTTLQSATRINTDSTNKYVFRIPIDNTSLNAGQNAIITQFLHECTGNIETHTYGFVYLNAGSLVATFTYDSDLCNNVSLELSQTSGNVSPEWYINNQFVSSNDVFNTSAYTKGNYLVRLNIQDNVSGCFASATETVIVGGGAVPNINRNTFIYDNNRAMFLNSIDICGSDNDRFSFLTTFLSTRTIENIHWRITPFEQIGPNITYGTPYTTGVPLVEATPPVANQHTYALNNLSLNSLFLNSMLQSNTHVIEFEVSYDCLLATDKYYYTFTYNIFEGNIEYTQGCPDLLTLNAIYTGTQPLNILTWTLDSTNTVVNMPSISIQTLTYGLHTYNLEIVDTAGCVITDTISYLYTDVSVTNYYTDVFFVNRLSNAALNDNVICENEVTQINMALDFLPTAIEYSFSPAGSNSFTIDYPFMPFTSVNEFVEYDQGTGRYEFIITNTLDIIQSGMLAFGLNTLSINIIQCRENTITIHFPFYYQRLPRTNFTYFSDLCGGVAILATNTSIIATSDYTLTWYVDNNQISSNETLLIASLDKGYHNIVLHVIDDNNCSNVSRTSFLAGDLYAPSGLVNSIGTQTYDKINNAVFNEFVHCRSDEIQFSVMLSAVHEPLIEGVYWRLDPVVPVVNNYVFSTNSTIGPTFYVHTVTPNMDDFVLGVNVITFRYEYTCIINPTTRTISFYYLDYTPEVSIDTMSCYGAALFTDITQLLTTDPRISSLTSRVWTLSNFPSFVNTNTNFDLLTSTYGIQSVTLRIEQDRCTIEESFDFNVVDFATVSKRLDVYNAVNSMPQLVYCASESDTLRLRFGVSQLEPTGIRWRIDPVQSNFMVDNNPSSSAMDSNYRYYDYTPSSSLFTLGINTLTVVFDRCNNNSDTRTIEFEILRNPDVNFDFHSNLCTGTALILTDTSVSYNGNLRHSWFINTSLISTNRVFVAQTYPEGNYTLRHIVVDDQNCSNEETRNIQIGITNVPFVAMETIVLVNNRINMQKTNNTICSSESVSFNIALSSITLNISELRYTLDKFRPLSKAVNPTAQAQSGTNYVINPMVSDFLNIAFTSGNVSLYDNGLNTFTIDVDYFCVINDVTYNFPFMYSVFDVNYSIVETPNSCNSLFVFSNNTTASTGMVNTMWEIDDGTMAMGSIYTLSTIGFGSHVATLTTDDGNLCSATETFMFDIPQYDQALSNVFLYNETKQQTMTDLFICAQDTVSVYFTTTETIQSITYMIAPAQTMSMVINHTSLNSNTGNLLYSFSPNPSLFSNALNTLTLYINYRCNIPPQASSFPIFLNDPQADFDYSTDLCASMPLILTNTTMGYASPYTATWRANGMVLSDALTTTINNVSKGYYTIELETSDKVGCSSNSSTLVPVGKIRANANEQKIFSVYSDDLKMIKPVNTICAGESFDLILVVVATNTVGGVEWNVQPVQSSLSPIAPSARSGIVHTYTLNTSEQNLAIGLNTLTAIIDYQCIIETETYEAAFYYSNVVPVADISTSNCNHLFTFEDRSITSFNITNRTWTFDIGLVSTTPIVAIDTISYGRHTFTLHVEDTYGCNQSKEFSFENIDYYSAYRSLDRFNDTIKRIENKPFVCQDDNINFFYTTTDYSLSRITWSVGPGNKGTFTALNTPDTILNNRYYYKIDPDNSLFVPGQNILSVTIEIACNLPTFNLSYNFDYQIFTPTIDVNSFNCSRTLMTVSGRNSTATTNITTRVWETSDGIFTGTEFRIEQTQAYPFDIKLTIGDNNCDVSESLPYYYNDQRIINYTKSSNESCVSSDVVIDILSFCRLNNANTVEYKWALNNIPIGGNSTRVILPPKSIISNSTNIIDLMIIIDGNEIYKKSIPFDVAEVIIPEYKIISSGNMSICNNQTYTLANLSTFTNIVPLRYIWTPDLSRPDVSYTTRQVEENIQVFFPRQRGILDYNVMGRMTAYTFVCSFTFDTSTLFYNTPEIFAATNIEFCQSEENVVSLSPYFTTLDIVNTWSYTINDDQAPIVDFIPSKYKDGTNYVEVDLSNGICADNIRTPFQILSPPTINFNHGSFYFQEQGRLGIDIVADANYTITWSDNVPLLERDSPNPLVELLDNKLFSVTVVDDRGCFVASETIVRLYDEPFTNSFTPNGDGFNDVLDLSRILQYFPEALLQIYNRNGSLIYETNALTWDFKYEGEIVPQDAYVFQIFLDEDRTRSATMIINVFKTDN